MPASPKTPKYTFGLPAGHIPLGRRCHGQRRFLYLFTLILLVSSGSMIVLHITTSSFPRSGSSSCEAFSSSSSGDCPVASRSRWRPDREEYTNDKANPSYGTNSPFKNHDRPRAALPRPADNPVNDRQDKLDLSRPAPPVVPPIVPQQENVQETKEQYSVEHNDAPESPLSNLTNGENSEESMKDEEGEEEEGDEEQTIALPFEDTLDNQDSTKYLTYLPYAGITNQFYGILRGMEVAKALGRTLIIPPITASSHDKSKQNQPWSRFLDLAKFSELTGTNVIEFHQLRDVERAELNTLKCGITCGFGSKRTIDFTAKGFLKQWKFDVTLNPLQTDATKLETITELLRSQNEEKFLCISNTYKIVVKNKSEWERFGQHLHFTEELESFVQEFLAQNIVKPDSEEDPKTKQLTVPEYQYLAIHVRRGDFAAYCESNFPGPRLVHCFPTTEQIAERIDAVQKKLNPTMDPSKILPVFVATNERRPEELKKFAELGWRFLDHDQIGTVEKLGTFGPMMVDQVFMAHAQGLVGIQMSTFSRVGGLRQRDWHSREVEYM
ncbi:hypothetical protein BGX27_009394 [Mortierella sp. AM989]|nr:hypothetical protein BGX27_009394 [Mortierella sp. AM989]